MKVSDLKQIYKLVNANGIINEITIDVGGMVTAVDVAKTFIVKLD